MKAFFKQITNFFLFLKRWLITLPPVKFVIRGSKKWKPPGFQGIPLYDVVQFFYKQVKTVGMSERAAAVSFNFVMAIPPSLIFLFTLVPFFPINRQFEFELYNLIRSIVPGDENNGAIISFLKDFINKPRSGLLSIGFLLSLFFSSNAMIGIMRSFDKNYVGFKKRKGLQKRRDALKITLVLFFFVILSIVLLVLQGTVLKWLGIQNANVRSVLNIIRWILIIILFFTSISYIYRNAPAVHKKWRFINPGSILAAFLMILFTLAFSWWVTNFSNYNELYGSISAILIIMLLIFFNSLVLMIGFELNVSINALKKIADERATATASGKEIPA